MMAGNISWHCSMRKMRNTALFYGWYNGIRYKSYGFTPQCCGLCFILLFVLRQYVCCSAAASSAVDGRHTRRSTIAVRAAGGRRTMINTMQTQSLYLTMVLKEGRKGLTKRVHLY